MNPRPFLYLIPFFAVFIRHLSCRWRALLRPSAPLRLFACHFVAVAVSALVLPAAERPNIVLIFIDDMGYGDVGFNRVTASGAPGDPSRGNADQTRVRDARGGATGPKTPNIDRMAAEGMIFDDFYVGCAVCSGSRTALMTGCHYQRLSMKAVLFPDSEEGLHPDEVTIADMLKEAGYRTACVGKWHLGHLPPCLPTYQGFESYYGVPYSNDMWIDPANKLAENIVLREGLTLEEVKAGHKKRNLVPLMRNEKVIEYPADQTTLTKRYTEEAINFIQSCASPKTRAKPADTTGNPEPEPSGARQTAEGSPKGEAGAPSQTGNAAQPFFLYLPHTMVHLPLAVSKAFDNPEKELIHNAIEEVDWSVGKVLEAIEVLGLDEKTLVIFTSDNGAAVGSSLPLRSRKSSVYDGGIREPTVMRWPGQIPAGKKCTEVAATIDILPTLAKLCGGKLPARVIDGLDIWPLMSGAKGAKSPHKEYALMHGPGTVRSGKWKFYPWQEGKGGRRDSEIPKGHTPSAHPVQLYDTDADIAERVNLAAEYPEVAARLGAVYEKHVAGIESRRRPTAPMPRPEGAPSAKRPGQPRKPAKK